MILENLVQDLRYAVRGLRSKPGFALAVIATLGLGIGANAAMFGIVDRLLFRPPALMKDPETAHRIYLYRTVRGKERSGDGGQYMRFKDMQRLTTRTMAAVAGFSPRDMAIGVGDAAREMRVVAVSANFFGFFDAPPALGRYFLDSEDQPPAGTNVAVLSYPMWQTQYGGSKDALGKTVQIGPTTYTVIGVSAPGFVGLWSDKPPAAFIPLTSYAAGMGFKPRGRQWWETYSWGWMQTMVRRKPNVTVAAANADLTNAYLKSLELQREEQPGGLPLAELRPRGEIGPILFDRGPNASSVSKVATWVGGVSVIVLLIACANVANLLLARALKRKREVALRIALGVSRGRLLAQLLTESLLLAALGGVAGLLLAHWGGAALRAGLLDKSEAAAGLRDPRTVLFAAGTAVVVGLLTGLAPILQAGRANLTGDLKAGSREGTYHRSPARVGLLILQAALSVILLVGAGLFVRSLHNVENTRLGYDVDPVMVVSLNMRGVKLDSTATIALRQQLLSTAKTIPGVTNAALQITLPFWSQWSMGLTVAGIDSVSKLGQFDLNAVSPEYFDTFGTKILRGRGISEADQANAPKSAVVSDAMAKVLWPGKDAVGQCFKIGADSMPCTYVVGIAENIKEQSLSADSGYFYYVSAAQFRPQEGGLFVRVRGDASKFKEAVRQGLQKEMPGASYVTITALTEVVGGQKKSWQLGATMFVAFGVLALVLAAIGLYSVISYNVAQRTHELGVRRALGAQAADVVRLVVADGLKLAVIGVVLGVGVAVYAGKWVKPLLFDVSPKDPWVFVSVAVALIAVALAASWIPALRASRVDANVALRSD